jgi:hypothetical protein
MPVCSFQGGSQGGRRQLKGESMTLNPSEVRLIQTIRGLNFGSVTVNIQDNKIRWIKREENIKIE